jgi:hypothetical protein
VRDGKPCHWALWGYLLLKISFGIALVGCDTTNIKQGLARNFAKTIYDNMPALRTAQITGRGGELEVNENGTKTMKTWGYKSHCLM